MEIDLLRDYPKTPRNLDKRAAERTGEDREIARRFDREFFDGERRTGYGGYRYSPRFWQPVVSTMKEHYGICAGHRILDVGCAKGFMLHDFRELIPGIEVAGLDISEYAVANAMEDVRPELVVGTAKQLPFPDAHFDLVISINTVHNLEHGDCVNALLEIERVSRANKFITVDAYNNSEEQQRMNMWNLTALTYMSVSEWKELFSEIGYDGDYHWFIP